ncbi:outer membrane beta-barrel protein [Anaeroselena agilis]|uniref:Outer membrane beta-barrel protein n=1 Tax=Anaeroselena agilis TaxID=3063788 RepID=A0ABU3NVT3_9FIRM|nr:outer membrane beta-barrel protein [Selenomonadales bacterium 4137-cl]
MKKVILSMVFLLVFSVTAFASPVTDLAPGKVGIDLTYRTGPSMKLSNDSGSVDPKGKGNLDFGVTIGIADKWGIQYRQWDTTGKTWTNQGGNPETDKAYFKEANILYTLDKNLAAYIGFTQSKLTIEEGATTYGGKNKNKVQVGLIGKAPLGNNLTGYASIGAGSDLFNWEVGLSTKVWENAEFNVSYRGVKVNKLELDNLTPKFDYDVKGFGFGLNVKF